MSGRRHASPTKLGFTQISVSHEVSPLVKFVGRGDTTVVDAYLSPLLRRYVDRVARALAEETKLLFMQSSGGLTSAHLFQGKDAILSGPTGGVVGAVETARIAGFDRLIGFDMGGTSTDVCHFDGVYERTFESVVAGVRVRAPMMLIHTVAAGGGSILGYDGARLRVGPDSAGANPGPACYRRGGPLTVTDANVMVGKLVPSFFPKIFGPGQDEPLDAEIVRTRFAALGGEIGDRRAAEEIASGFIRIAVENMANAIKTISVQRGYDVTDYVLNSFGGAGGQHACLVAEALGISRVLIHPLSGVLSAYGMGLAELKASRSRAVLRLLDDDGVVAAEALAAPLAGDATAELIGQGVDRSRVRVTVTLHLRYLGTDSALPVPLSGGSSPQIEASTPLTPTLSPSGRGSAPHPTGDAGRPPHKGEALKRLRDAFEAMHQQRFGFVSSGKPIEIEADRGRGAWRRRSSARGAADSCDGPAKPTNHDRAVYGRRLSRRGYLPARRSAAGTSRTGPCPHHRAASDRGCRARLAGRRHGEGPSAADARRGTEGPRYGGHKARPGDARSVQPALHRDRRADGLRAAEHRALGQYQGAAGFLLRHL